MASSLFAREITARLLTRDQDWAEYALDGLACDHKVFFALRNEETVSKAVIARNSHSKMVGFDLEMRDARLALCIVSWEAETLLVRDGEPMLNFARSIVNRVMQ